MQAIAGKINCKWKCVLKITRCVDFFVSWWWCLYAWTGLCGSQTSFLYRYAAFCSYRIQTYSDHVHVSLCVGCHMWGTILKPSGIPSLALPLRWFNNLGCQEIHWFMPIVVDCFPMEIHGFSTAGDPSLKITFRRGDRNTWTKPILNHVFLGGVHVPRGKGSITYIHLMSSVLLELYGFAWEW